MPSERPVLRNLIEFAVARTLLLAMEVLPDGAVPVTSGLIGRALHRVLASRRRVVAENVARAYGGAPGAPDADELSRASLTNLARSFLELARLTRDPHRLKHHVRVKSPENWAEIRGLLDRGPAVFAASHFGGYLVGGVAAPLLPIPLTTLVRPLDNPWLERYVNGIRTRFGQEVASNREGTTRMLQALRAGRSVAVLVDLNMKRSGRVFVDYFGLPAATAKTAGLLACKVKCPLIPVFTHRVDRPMRFEIEFGVPQWPDPRGVRKVEVERLLQAVTDEIERKVRRSPDQWLWTHRRWKTRPDEDQARA